MVNVCNDFMADRGNICRSASPHTACNSPVAETKTPEPKWVLSTAPPRIISAIKISAIILKALKEH